MSQTAYHLIETMTQYVSATASQSAVPLMLVGAYAVSSVILYKLTQGKEFLICGYSSVLFLVPFFHA